MKGEVDPCVRVGILSASPLPRGATGSDAFSWVVEAKILKQDQEQSDEEPYRTKPSRVGVWNEELTIPVDVGEARSSRLRLDVVDATLREGGLHACTFQLGHFVPWNGYHLEVHMGRDVRLRVSIVVALEDPVVKIDHLLHLEALLLTFPEGMPLPGVRREAGAGVKSFIQCIPKGTENNVSLQASKKKEPPMQRCDAAGEKVIELDALGSDRNEGNNYLRNTVPVTIVEDQVAWIECVTFPVGPRVKKTFMAHTQAYPRQLYGKGIEWSMCQVSFLITFFFVEASSQSSTALGYAVLDVPDDVRLSDGGAELSAVVTSPEGNVLEDVVCVVDIKASGPPPQSPRGSDASSVGKDDDNDDLDTSNTEGSESQSESQSELHATAIEGRRSSPKKSKDRRKSTEKHAEADNELRSQVEAVRGQLRAVYAEADRKQSVVNNLSEQVEKRSDAIRKCGAEIVKLRKYIENVDQERYRLHFQLKSLRKTTAEAEMAANRVMKAMEGEDPARGLHGDTGGRHTRALAKRCIVLTEENRTLRRVAQDCAHEQWQTAVLKSEMEKMKNTQHVQAVYIRKMQALPGKVSAYKSTVTMQEKVIAKLEMLIAGRRAVNSGSTDDGEDPSAETKRSGNGPEVERIRKENASLRWRLAMAGTKSTIDVQGQASDDAGVMLKMKDTKIRILEEQMVTNAKAAGEEIAALHMRLMEMEFHKSDSLHTSTEGVMSTRFPNS